ncbi:MAG TPA: VTT domain-containing protein [Bryobacteraceae bacterium]|jgi:membrane protein DedA with SNARE-associated domain|nr:VTT domain-containing protein [Bryobacteraceae bacterium]
MHAVIPFLLRHGYWVLVANVFAEGIGLPIPALPVLLGMGALAGLGNFSIWTSLGLAVAASLSSDIIWFLLGGVRGTSILNLLCRMSLEPDSCVSNTKSLFGRLGARALLIAKFVPGLGATAAPLAGLTRMNPWRFIAADTAGSLIYCATYLGVGYLFRDQLELAAEQAGRMGSFLVIVIGAALTSYICWKYYQRRRFIRGLRVARITPEALMQMITAGDPIAVVDLRHELEVEADKVKLPGAIWMTLAEIDTRHEEIPRDREIILYCS